MIPHVGSDPMLSTTAAPSGPPRALPPAVARHAGLLNDTVYVITGADGYGTGSALMFQAAEWGAYVVGCGLDARRGQEIVDSINGTAGRRQAVFVEADLRRRADARRVMQVAVETFGRVDALINNAGLARRGDHLMKSEVTDLLAAVESNTGTALLATQEALAHMRPRRSGKIVYVSSVNALSGQFLQPCYAAAKAGLSALARQFTTVFFRYGITTNVVVAGTLPNSSDKHNERRAKYPGFEAGLAMLTARRRLTTNAEIAQAILALTTEPFAVVSGEEIVIDGGQIAAGGPLGSLGVDFRQIASDLYSSRVLGNGREIDPSSPEFLPPPCDQPSARGSAGFNPRPRRLENGGGGAAVGV